MSSKDGEEALLVWVQSFPDLEKVESLQDLASGTFLANICTRIDAEHFSDEWLNRLTNTNRENTHLCQLNSNKLVEKVIEYYTQRLQREFMEFSADCFTFYNLPQNLYHGKIFLFNSLG